MLITKQLRFQTVLNLKNISKLVPKPKKNILNRSLPIATRTLLNRNFLSPIHQISTSSVLNSPESQPVDSVRFEKVCEETLQSLSDYFEELVDNASHLRSADVAYSVKKSGVLTINFGPSYGTYVINRQSPNKQIWLSSPTSGPKRYDFVTEGDYWVYRHDGKSLHRLLQEEIGGIVKSEVDFSRCLFSRV